jgi:hypothetical protein
VLAIAATLLVAAFATAPARAQEVPTAPPSDATQVDPPTTDASPPPTAPDPGPQVSAPPDTTQQPDQPADPVVTEDPGAGETAAETPQSPQSVDRAPAHQPAHSGDGSGQTSSAAAPTVPTVGGDTTVDTVAPRSDGYPGTWSGQDTFVVDKAKDRSTGPPTAFGGPRGPLAGLYVLRAASRATNLEAKARRSHTAAQVTPLGGPPGSGNQLPGHNPFFNLLSGTGGSAAGLAFASILAILGVAFVLPRDRSRIFRMPTVTWRPSAYVPPIELPG